MAGGHLTHDEFFTKLSEHFTYRKGQDHGSIMMVQKRLSYGQDLPAPTPENPMPDLSPAQPLPLLVRATNAKSKQSRDRKLKLSTVVDPADLDAFYARYAEVCKAGMAGLKPRDKSKKKAKAKKRRVGASAAPVAAS